MLFLLDLRKAMYKTSKVVCLVIFVVCLGFLTYSQHLGLLNIAPSVIFKLFQCLMQKQSHMQSIIFPDFGTKSSKKMRFKLFIFKIKRALRLKVEN